MSNHDPISDMLTRIRNASQKKHTTTTIPGSKMSLSIAKVLKKEGFISDINEEGEGYKSQIILGLKYSGKNKFPTIRSMQRVSKPGLRIYKNTRALPSWSDLALVTIVISIPLIESILSKEISGKINCSLTPTV